MFAAWNVQLKDAPASEKIRLFLEPFNLSNSLKILTNMSTGKEVILSKLDLKLKLFVNLFVIFILLKVSKKFSVSILTLVSLFLKS